MKYLVSFIPVLLLTGCGDEVSKVKDELIDYRQAYKNGLILDGRAVCKDTIWQSYEEEGNRFVKYSCLLASSNGFATYNKEDMENIVREKQEALNQELTLKQDVVINTYQEGIDKLERYINEFEGLSTQERNEIAMYTIGGIPLRDSIRKYAETPEGKEVFKSLSIMNTGFRLKSPVADFNVKVRSVDPEIQQAIKRILLDTFPPYIDRVKAKLGSVKLSMTEEKTVAVNNYSAGLIREYEKTHPLSRTEVVIWTWNKLDQRYVRVNQYVEQEWVNGGKTKNALCLERITYSVTHNVTNPDDYYNLNRPNDYCMY